jgi:uncharacterized protein YbjT (DUF2867 family)
MESKRTILVVGATGAQGGSVAHHLLQSNGFTVRALTRHADSEKAKALAAAGAQLVTGDLDDKESLHRALEGCDGVFGVTNFWEHFEKEYNQGINLVDAVAASGVKQFVFSTLPYISQLTNGQLPVTHFDTKGRLQEYARSKKSDTTFVHLAFYYENFFSFIPLTKESDGVYSFAFPMEDAPMAAVSVGDVGGILLPVFQNPEAYAGATIEAVGEFATCSTYADIMSKVSGKKIVYRHVPRETYAAFPFPGAEEMANMFTYYKNYLPYRQGLENSKKLYPGLKSFEQKLTEDKDAFMKVLA